VAPRINPLSRRSQNRNFTGAEITDWLRGQMPMSLAASKRARVVREKGEFNLRALAEMLRPPVSSSGAASWSIEQIVAARDQQMAGRFRGPQKLSASFSTDDAIFTARAVRLSPVRSLGVKIAEAPRGKGDKLADEAEALFGSNGIAISSETDSTIRQQIVDHGVGFGAVTWCPRADGSRWDPVLNAWPIEWVYWHENANCYVTTAQYLDDTILMGQDPDGTWTPRGGFHQTAGRTELTPMIHGDGRWVVFRKSELLPHQFDATILPAAMVWARHAFGNRDWAKGSATHGNAKVVGEMAPDTPLSDAAGNLTAEAAAFLQLVLAIASQDAPAGIRPSGSKIDYITNSSQAWEVWAKLVENAERAAARIYLGTDGVLGAQGGAPGVDISALFGVATSMVQSDLRCIERGVQSGLIAPWAAINFGNDKLAPSRTYVFPDPDESRVREDFGKRNAAFQDAITKHKANGFVLTQDYVNALAKEYGGDIPVPQLPAAPTTPQLPAAPVTPAPTAAS
jgi:hypothetical protein